MIQDPPYKASSDGKKSFEMAADGQARSKLMYLPDLRQHPPSALRRSNISLRRSEWTYWLGLFGVAEHQPAPPAGHKSVTLTTTLLVTFGKKGGVPVYESRRVILKQRPQEGPYPVLLPYAY